MVVSNIGNANINIATINAAPIRIAIAFMIASLFYCLGAVSQ